MPIREDVGGEYHLLDLDLHNFAWVLDDFGDVCAVAGTDFAENTLVDEDDTADEPVTLYQIDQTRELGGEGGRRTQKTPMVLKEQYGGRSGLIMQNMPWSCQLMKKTMNRWCEYLYSTHQYSSPGRRQQDSPEALKVGTTPLLHCVPNHDTQSSGHNPSCKPRPSGKVCLQEQHQERSDLLGLREAETGKVDHVREDMDDCEEDDRPCCGFVERDILVEGDDVTEGGDTEEGDEVSADGEEDECCVDV